MNLRNPSLSLAVSLTLLALPLAAMADEAKSAKSFSQATKAAPARELPATFTAGTAASKTFSEVEGYGEMAGDLRSSDPVFEDGTYFDEISWTGAAGGRLRIDMLSGEFDTFLLVLDANGNELARNDDGPAGSDAQVTVTVPGNGAITIAPTTTATLSVSIPSAATIVERTTKVR